jgi:tryptophanyl-tRNA synthetase
MTLEKPKLLTGDTPTGKLHLGHWVGTLENRVRLQEEGNYECFFIIANTHAFTTRYKDPAQIRENTIDVALDYLAAGIDPAKSNIFIQSEIPAIAELTFLFSMLVSHARVLRNPTLKQELKDKDLGDKFSFGFALYPVGQIADILSFRPSVIPVGEDQLPHLEMANEVARRFNQIYCNVDPAIPDSEQEAAGGLFPIPHPLVGRVRRLIGMSAPDEKGNFSKMSKSLGNAIMLSDSPDEIKDKIMKMYTDPNRLRASDPGTVENNPLWIFHDTFTLDREWVEEAKARYRAGKIGDVECKKKLVESVVSLTEPMRQRRLDYEKNLDHVFNVLSDGTARANEVAEITLNEVKLKIHQNYFTGRKLSLEM